MINALDIAYTFLTVAKKENISITPMKLQRLIYLYYRNYLKATRTRLFSERFEVWEYGPVLPSVYNTFKKFRFNCIDIKDKRYTTINLEQSTMITKIFWQTWETYYTYNAIYLSHLVTRKHTAWYKAKSRSLDTLQDDDIYHEQEVH